MAQSLNTRSDFATEAIVYLGFAEYGKIMLGDNAFEFFNDKNVNKNIQFPWHTILRVEGDVSKSGKIGRHFAVVLQNGSKVRFSAKESGTVLKWMREYLGNEKVVKAPSFFKNISKIFNRNK